MSKRTKILLIVLAIPLVLLAALVLFLKLYFTSDRLKALIIPKVEETIQRSVSVGDISLSLFPRLAVNLERLSISAPKESAFDKEEFLSLEELVLDVHVFALLDDRVEIDEIILTQPKLYLEVNKQGIANYAQPPGPPTEEPSRAIGEEAPGTPLDVLLSNFQVIDGTIEYVDKTADRRVLIDGYHQIMRARVDGNEVFLESESHVGSLSYGSTKSFLITGLPIVTYQRLTYKQAEDLLSLDSISVGIREIALVLQGSVEHVQTTPRLHLTLASTRAEVAQLLSLVPKDFMKAAEGLSSSGTFQFTMDVQGEVGDSLQPAVRGVFTVSDGTIQYKALPKSITNINVRGSFERPPVIGGRQRPGKFTLETFSANFGTSTIAGKLGIVDFDDPTISASFNGNLQLGEIKEYYPLEAGTELTGVVTANFSITGKARNPLGIKSDGKVEFRSVTIKTATSKKPLENLNGVITFNNQLIDSKRLAMNVGASDMILTFTMRNYLALVSEDAATSGKPSMLVTLTSRQLRAEDLMSEEAGASAAQRQSATPPKPSAMLLPNIDVDANVSIDRLVTEKFDFNNARGSVKIREGVITLQNFSVNAFQGNVVTAGMLDLRRLDKRPFDLSLEITGVEAHAMLPKFTSFGNNIYGKFSMTTSLKGELNDTLGLNPPSLNGGGTVHIFDGKLVGYPLTIKLAEVTGIDEFRALQIKQWSNEYTIADGRINIKDLRVMATGTEFVVNGWQGVDGSLDYKMLVRLPASLSGRLRISGVGAEVINFLKDNEGRVNLHFKVTGTVSDPSFALDTEEAQRKARQALEQKAKEEAERLAEEAKKKAEAELKKKAEEGLKKLFKKP